jgi:hypothetical protein
MVTRPLLSPATLALEILTRLLRDENPWVFVGFDVLPETGAAGVLPETGAAGVLPGAGAFDGALPETGTAAVVSAPVDPVLVAQLFARWTDRICSAAPTLTVN